MSKALVIKGANFSANALTTITFENSVDCTGISLDKATSTITSIGGTDTLVATTTPADTTDQIIWSSSDDTVATVSNGVVTAVGLGSATITATCGSYSATCAIAVRAFMDKTTFVLSSSVSGDSLYSGGNGLPTLSYVSTSPTRCSVVAPSGSFSFYRATEGTMYYPYPIPEGTKRIKITTPTTGDSAMRTDGLLFCSLTSHSVSNPTVAKLVDKPAWASLTPTDGVIVIDVPEYDGYPTVDAIAVCFKLNASGGTFLASYLDDVEIEFLPAAE